MVRAEGAVRPSETGTLFVLVTIKPSSINPFRHFAPPPSLQLPFAFPTTIPATTAHRLSDRSALYAAPLSGLSSPSVPPQFDRLLRYPISAAWLQNSWLALWLL
ncbi:hypothetical protein R3P38DRAFT_3211467 [Favolaschia claudopus]|uniref:Uncharacterized protein n=1 Tax=Favolaschia claudopus TaxID=2862362 RepID=A0AAW0AFJ5_9AGAR